MTDFLLKSNTTLNKMLFSAVTKMSKNDIKVIFKKLMESGLDDNSHGFWIWDLKADVELYSPKFRSSLQYSGEEDFPSVPLSWQNAIYKEDLLGTLENFKNHVESRGEAPFEQVVRYRKKYKGSIIVLCHGDVTAWSDEGDPLVMVGVHMNNSGMYV